MSEEIKVGDWVATECNLWVLKVSELFEEDGIYFLSLKTPHSEIILEKKDCKKVYVYDTPQTTQTEVEIKSGHFAGYGVEKPKVVQMTAPYENYPEHVLYDNGLIFQYYETTGEWQKRKIPHEQEDLKHLFE